MLEERDLDLLYEVGCIRFIPRAWNNIFHADTANLAEHHFRVAWISMLLCKMEGRGDMGKITQIALVHDVAESRTGDVHAISRQYTKRNEHLAVNDIFENTTLKETFVPLIEEYEKRESIEAQIVKDADFLDVDLEFQEQIAKGRKDFEKWLPRRKTFYEKFYTESAKKLWEEIYKSSPENWYLNARSRFSEGDMSK